MRSYMKGVSSSLITSLSNSLVSESNIRLLSFLNRPTLPAYAAKQPERIYVPAHIVK